MSGRMNWDRVHREDRVRRAVRSAPSGSWQPGGSWKTHDPLEVAWRPRAKAERRRPKNRGRVRSGSMGYGFQPDGPAAVPTPERAEIQRRQSRVRQEIATTPVSSSTAGLPNLRVLAETGLQRLFAKPTGHGDQQTDWIIWPVTDPNDAIVLAAERDALLRLVRAAIDAAFHANPSPQAR